MAARIPNIRIKVAPPAAAVGGVRIRQDVVAFGQRIRTERDDDGARQRLTFIERAVGQEAPIALDVVSRPERRLNETDVHSRLPLQWFSG
jgi:hypothetical protein